MRIARRGMQDSYGTEFLPWKEPRMEEAKN
jgi:hypothetical protein